MSMTIEEIRATRPDLAEKVERGILALKDASSAAEERNHKAAYAPRETWRPKVHEGSGLQRLTDYRPLTDFKEIRQWVLNRDKHICHYCQSDATEVDHLWPRRFGGKDHINNLVAACRKCNGSKGASINLSTARADLIECGLEAIVARLQLEIAELERWSRAYADTLARNAVGNGSELLSLAFDIGDPLIELQSIKRVLQTKADSALSPGVSA